MCRKARNHGRDSITFLQNNKLILLMYNTYEPYLKIKKLRKL